MIDNIDNKITEIFSKVKVYIRRVFDTKNDNMRACKYHSRYLLKYTILNKLLFNLKLQYLKLQYSVEQNEIKIIKLESYYNFLKNKKYSFYNKIIKGLDNYDLKHKIYSGFIDNNTETIISNYVIQNNFKNPVLLTI